LDVEAVIEASQTCITPFMEHPRELPILNMRLEEHQRRTLNSLNIPIVSPESRDVKKGRLVLKDTLFSTKELLTVFLEESQRIDQPTQCAIKKGALTQRSITVTMDVDDLGESIGYRLYYYPPGSDQSTALKPIVIDADEYVQEMMFPDHMVPGGVYKVPITKKIIFQIEHWTNLWACNIGALLGNIADLKSDRSKQLRFAVKAFSTNQWRVSSKNVRIGKGCDIHPTAYIENSVIGDGVEIGALSVIRGSMIGDRSVINNNCTVAYSVLGEECQLRDGSNVTYSLLFPGALTTCSFLNTSVMGRDSFFPVGSVLTDYRFDGTCVTVMKDGKAVDSGYIILGCCLGHNAYVGAGVVVPPGREIPNGARLLPGHAH
jgi:carbonic anhydrase/acetyltransferase-like protein (isoleucine patch superfamily)